MKYGITQRQIAHVVKDGGNAGPHAWWVAECGAWIRPTVITDRVPDGARLCKKCAKWIDRNKAMLMEGDRETQEEHTRQAPTIVRCGECKYNKNCILITEGDFVATDFCSAGERKENIP